MDPIKKLNEIKEINDKLFSEALFRRESKTFNYNRNGVSGYVLRSDGTKNPFKFFSDKNLEYVVSDEDIWTEGGILNWLKEGVWQGDHVIFDRQGLKFSGLWIDGDFKGYSFFAKSKPFNFEDGKFMGQFYRAPYWTYKAGTANYYSGSFLDDTEGVLGKKYLEDGVYDTGVIDLFLVGVGKYFTIKSGGEISEFLVKKGLGREGVDFTFVHTKDGTTFEVKWETIRQKYETGTGGVEIGKSFNFPGYKTFAKVDSVEITKEPKFKAPEKQKGPEDLSSFNLRSLGFGRDEIVNLDIADPTQQQIVNMFIEEISNGTFKKKIDRIRRLIFHGIITGHGGSRTLDGLFNGVKGNYEGMSDDEKKEISENLSYLSKFIVYFLTAIKLPAKVAQINSWLKRSLGIDKYITKEKPEEPKEKPGEEPEEEKSYT